ncbi:MAG: extracellular solute-binding protein [Chloroflexota bacterium]
MQSSRRFMLTILVAVLGLVAIAPLGILRAQDTAVTISLAVPPFLGDSFNGKLIQEFESTHPGIKVNVVKVAADLPFAANDLDKHFEAVEKYAKSADVLYADIFTISPEATRAGYFLDLNPLVAEDKTLNTDDFFPTVWQSFQWDRGVWALPTAADAFILTYNPAAFDKAGVEYPNDKWTVDDMASAIRKLAVKDSSGKVITAGMDLQPVITPYMLRIFLNEPLFDSSTIPNTPKFDTPAVTSLLDTWKKLDDEGVIGADFNKAPLTLNNAVTVLFQGKGDPDTVRVGALLPGGKAGLATQGFALSGGTQYPTQAYALASWLTTRAEVVSSAFASSPARKSLVGKSTDVGSQGFQLNVTPEVQALIDQSIANGITLSDLRYVDYLGVAYQKMKTDNIDAATALQNAEASAIKAQASADERKDKLKASLVVATPVPAANLAEGKISIKFGVNLLIPTFPNKEQWSKAAADFVASDSQVGAVTVEPISTGASLDLLKSAADKYDCFYLSFNAVGSSSIDSVLTLDPYLASDPTFDKADVIGNVMAQVQRSNKTYALPADIQPNVLKYDADRFAKAGVTPPASISDMWTVETFKDTLTALKVDPKDPPPFAPFNTFGSYMLSLTAAYGGLPLDFRTNPPTINFSDPKTVDAVRQVLDLAKKGLIKYRKLGDLNAFDISLLPEKAIIVQESLGGFALRLPGSEAGPTYKIALYPKGRDFTAVTYNMGTLYISAKAAAPEACYRVISAFSRNVTLFSSMPVRNSLLKDPALAAAQGPDAAALYTQIGTLLQDPTTVSIPMFDLSSQTTSLLYLWLYEAFDKYALKDADLDAALKDAEVQAKAFQECMAALPLIDSSSPDSSTNYLKGYKGCAIKSDPSLKSYLDTFIKD